MKNEKQILIVAVVILIIIGGFLMWNEDKTGDTTNTPISENQTQTQTSTTGGKKSATTKPGGTTPPVSPAVNPGATQNVLTMADLNGSIYKLTTYNGVAVPSDQKYTLSFENNVLSAKFCNSMSGNVVLDGTSLKVANLASTLMYCGTPSNLMNMENALTSMLSTGAVVYKNSNTIILSHATAGVMVFVSSI